MTEQQSELPNIDLTHAMVQDTMAKLMDAADVRKVYGRATKQGEVTIIPAAEVLVGMAFGVGAGGGSEPTGNNVGVGGGGGGGGRTLARPVAIVIVSPDGVRVEPVIDPTKIVMAAITAGGFMGGMIFRMLKSRRFGKKR